jgi:pyruvate dehydrogenase E1 component
MNNWQLEQAEWLDALEEIIAGESKENVQSLFSALKKLAARKGVSLSGPGLNTPYVNTIPTDEEPSYPGNLELEKKLENIFRWNAAAMVLKGTDSKSGVGGHISTYAGNAVMMEVAFNHFFRKRSAEYGGDIFMIQGHASPGVYARAFAEGRLNEQHLRNFRRELGEGGGLSSYPHPRRMPDFWDYPSVSMGLGPMMGLYQARFWKYLENRGLKPKNGGKVWCFIGDGEMDEPEIYGCINLAVREGLDNLIFILNCNLQRLDGPVRGNGKVIQEHERSFLGSGWEVIKVLWAGEWDALFAKDSSGKLMERLENILDGDFQYASTLIEKGDAAKLRTLITGGDADLEKLLSDLSDEQILKLNRGGHDHKKVYAAYHKAVNCGKPACIIMQTEKGHGLPSSGLNTAHNTKDFSDDTRVTITKRLGINLTAEQAQNADFYVLSEDSPEKKYLLEKRNALGGFLPHRHYTFEPLPAPNESAFNAFDGGSGEQTPSTTLVMVRIMTALTKDKEIGKYIVPIVPDEAQTFGLHGIFSSAGIYNPLGQQYTQMGIGSDALKYKEAVNGQVLQEGINEAGGISSFAAAGSAYFIHNIPTIPFYIYYSMFGFQRIGDFVWAAADQLCKGFLLGGTAGRTTLNGEGLQHEDGHSLTIASTVPSVISYDPAFAYEVATITKEGIRRMYVNDEALIYYIMLYNENYVMPSKPANCDEGILKGLYKFKTSDKKAKDGAKAHLLGSGSIMQQVLKAAEILENEFKIPTDIWSATSYVELTRDCTAVERRNNLNPTAKKETSYFENLFAKEEGVIVSASDYIKSLANGIAKWSPLDYTVLGTDGFGLSESRPDLRDYFEISPKFIVLTVLNRLATQGKFDWKKVAQYAKEEGIEKDKFDPTLA